MKISFCFPLFALLFLLPYPVQAYTYSYTPHVKPAVVHGYLLRKKDKCEQGKAFPFPKKAGACVTCPDDGYFLQNPLNKEYACFICPKASLLVLKHGYPMCLAQKPYEKSLDFPFSKELKENMQASLSADYVALDLNLTPKKNEKKLLINVCKLPFPTDPDALRAVASCKKLKETNDFLCPYVSQSPQGKWLCSACPKNTPFKNEDGSCFACPFGESSVLQEDGTSVCASEKKEK